MIVLSVISRHSSSPGTPAAPSCVATEAGNAGSSRQRVLTFTETGSVCPSSSRSRANASDWSRTTVVMRWMSVVLSASAMNSAGSSRPRVGCCQRTSASTPTSSPESAATLGWKYATRSPRSSAWRSSPRIASRCGLLPSRPIV